MNVELVVTSVLSFVLGIIAGRIEDKRRSENVFGYIVGAMCLYTIIRVMMS